MAALARAVEAMQRVQAERERVQAAMFQKLIDRIAPAPPARPAEDLRNAVTQVIDLQKEMRKAAMEEWAAHEEDDDEEDDEEEDGQQALATIIMGLVQQFAPLIAAKLATPKAQAKPAAEPAVAEPVAAAPVTAPKPEKSKKQKAAERWRRRHAALSADVGVAAERGGG